MPELNFVLIGSSRDKELLRRFLTDKPPNVEYLGSVTGDPKIELIRKCSAGLSTSVRETFGWVPFEFFKEGKTVVCPPIRSFKELYGDMPIYARTTEDFVNELKKLEKHDFHFSIDTKKLRRFEETYSLSKAADATVRKLSNRSITVLTRDTELPSDYVAGFLLVDWQLWRNIFDRNIDLRIISNGHKFAIQFGLGDQTSEIPRTVRILEARAERLEATEELSSTIARKIIRLVVYMVEPVCYVYSLMRRRAFSEFVLADGYAQITAAILTKLLFRIRAACLLHDDDFYRDISDQRLPLMWRILNAVLTRMLFRYVDQIIVVSSTLREEVAKFCPRPERITLLWS